MCAQITVLGTCHNVQGAERWHGRKLDDTQYRVVLERLVDESDFVFEEATGLGPTTAERLSAPRLGAGHYLDLDPPLDQRFAFGLAERTGDQSPIDPCDPNTDFCNSELVDPHARRENLWLHTIEEKTFDNGLLVCGFLHTLSMSFRLQSVGYTVRAFHYMPWNKFCQRRHFEEE